MKWIKDNFKWLVIGLAAVLAFLFLRSCGPSAKYIALKATYDQLVKDAAAQHATDLATIGTQTNTIAAKDQDIAAKQKRIDDLLGDADHSAATTDALRQANKRLREDAQAAIDSNPALQVLVHNFDLTIAEQDKTISGLRSVSALKDGIIADWTAKFDAQAVVSDTWKKAYDKEHALRLTCDSLNSSLAKNVKLNSVITRVAESGVVALAAVLVIQAIVKK